MPSSMVGGLMRVHSIRCFEQTSWSQASSKAIRTRFLRRPSKIRHPSLGSNEDSCHGRRRLHRLQLCPICSSKSYGHRGRELRLAHIRGESPQSGGGGGKSAL